MCIRDRLLTVDRGIDDPDFAIIDHNYFGDRLPVDGKAFPDASDNEFEAVRVGTSGTHQAGSFTRIESNYFERIQAEAEIISNKSSFNIIPIIRFVTVTVQLFLAMVAMP